MPSWGEILQEIQHQVETTGNPPDIDGIRRRYLKQLHEHTGRSVIVYAADMFGMAGPMASINLQDMVGMMEVFRDLPGPDLDLILTSSGGQAEATDRIVRYLRTKFTNVRVIVPLAAMSAATMWSMAADEIVLGKHSQLGPIDPQITLPNTGVPMPAGALTEQFREAQRECAQDPSKITGWLPTLQQYPPGLLNFCESATELSKQLVAEWLETYMFADEADPGTHAQEVSAWLADDKTHLSHSRAITRENLTSRGVKVVKLEDDETLQDLVLSVHHATQHTFGGSAVKLIENHLGRAFVQHGGQFMAMPQQVPQA